MYYKCMHTLYEQRNYILRYTKYILLVFPRVQNHQLPFHHWSTNEELNSAGLSENCVPRLKTKWCFKTKTKTLSCSFNPFSLAFWGGYTTISDVWSSHRSKLLYGSSLSVVSSSSDCWASLLPERRWPKDKGPPLVVVDWEGCHLNIGYPWIPQ